MLLVQFLALNCLTLALAPVHLRESDLARHLSSVLNLKTEIYGSLWKNQCFKQICHGLHYLPWGCLWFLTDSWLFVRKTGNWKGFVWRKKNIFLQGHPKQNIVRRCIPIKTQGAQAMYPSSVRHSPWGFFHFFLQHGPQITSYNHLGISSWWASCRCKSLRHCLRFKLSCSLHVTSDCSVPL